jgi:hypothetical protein
MASVEDYYFDQQSKLKHDNDIMSTASLSSFSENYEFLPQFNTPPSFESNAVDALIRNSNLVNFEQEQQQTLQHQNQQLQQQFQLHMPQFRTQETQLNQQSYNQQQQQQLQFYPFQTDNSQFEPYEARAEPLICNQHFAPEELGLALVNNCVFPPVDAFAPQIPTEIIHPNALSSTEPPRMRMLSESHTLGLQPNNSLLNSVDSSLSLSPTSSTFASNTQSDSLPTTVSASSSLSKDTLYNCGVMSKRFKVVRGISSGGTATKPPKALAAPNHHYAPVRLKILEAGLNDVCIPKWNPLELKDKRRIIRIERHQVGSEIIAQFSIVGSAEENPDTLPAQSGVDVVEVSCLECYNRPGDDADDDDDYDDELGDGHKEDSYRYSRDQDQPSQRSFYITSVEVIRILELLIGTEGQDAAERRRERGRIRSNLVSFWSKRPIRSKLSSSEARSSPLSPQEGNDFRIELATRIMAYASRKPRGFDKEVRILKWEKLAPSLYRALQSYYAEIPNDFD